MSIFAMRKATKLAAAGLVVVGSLALSACKSGDGSDGAAKSPTTAPSSPASPSSQPDQSTQPSSPADQGGAAGDAKGGQTFKIGEAAQFPF
ncbi:hypothetical protein ACFWX8_30625, partial [Streptomyces violascens]